MQLRNWDGIEIIKNEKQFYFTHPGNWNKSSSSRSWSMIDIPLAKSPYKELSNWGGKTIISIAYFACFSLSIVLGR